MTAHDETPDLLRRQFVDGSVWYDKDSIHPHDALLRSLVERGPFRDAVARAIPSLLASTDVRHRSGAVALLGELGADLGADAMAAWVEAGEAALRATRAAWTLEHEDLEACAAIAIAKAARPDDHVARAWLRRVAKERPWRVHVLAAVARLDPDWLVANAKELVSHDHLGLFDVLAPAWQDRLVDALSPYPPEEETFLTKAFWRRQRPDVAARLRGRMWPSKGASVAAIRFDPPPKIDFVAREIHVRLAYCGAPWSGRSTSLARVHERIAAPLRASVVAKSGSADVRTASSYLVLDRARHGMKVRVELATVPSARLHGPEVLAALLDGAHGFVYVLDTDPKRRGAAVDYRAWLDAELARGGTALAQVPHVWQVNLRDVPDGLSVAAACEGLVTDDAPIIAGSALEGHAPRVAVDTLLDLVLKNHGLLGGASRWRAWLADPTLAIALEYHSGSRGLVTTLTADGSFVVRRFGGPVFEMGRRSNEREPRLARHVTNVGPALYQRALAALRAASFPDGQTTDRARDEIASCWRVRTPWGPMAEMDAPHALHLAFPELGAVAGEIESRSFDLRETQAPTDVIANPELSLWDDAITFE